MEEVIEKVHKEQEVRNEKHDDELDKYAYSKEEWDKIINAPNEGGYVFEGAFRRYLEWVSDNMVEGVPFDPPIEEIPEEFRCFIK